MRRPSAHYITRGRLKFRFVQVLVNAVALLAIAGGLAAYFRGEFPQTLGSTRLALTPVCLQAL
jgi:corin